MTDEDLLRRQDRIRARERDACDIAKRFPYDVETVYRVLELAENAGLRDPEEFLRRCFSAALPPIEILGFALRTRTPGPFHSVYREAAGLSADQARLRKRTDELLAGLRGRKIRIEIGPKRRWLFVGIVGAVLSGGTALGSALGTGPAINLWGAIWLVAAFAACVAVVVVEAVRGP